MEIKIQENTKNRLKVELIGKTHTLCNLLAKELWNNKDIAIAGYTLEHPIINNSVLTIETTKGDAKKALIDAIGRISSDNKDFLSKFKSAAK
ncbi:MAG: DNA-directed RNA polymerase subunit L [archaeon]